MEQRTLDQKVAELVGQMTVEEKVALTLGKDFWHTQAIERLGIPSIAMNDGPHGVRKPKSGEEIGIGGSIPATCFPTASALAASWDTGLLNEVGQALGDECLALDVQVLLGPGLNIKRTPLCGRNFEYFSEDPVLSGELATAHVRGVQSRGIGTSVKHYACNNQEYERNTINVEVDSRTLHEIYLSGFERVVRQAEPWTVMGAYNRVDGLFACENPYLLREMLKQAWGFQGVVVSDWGAVNDKAQALLAGLDLEMPGGWRQPKIVELIKSGEIPEPVIDEAVNRLLRMILTGVANRKPGSSVNWDEHNALARRAAAESMVLLKNHDNILPLRTGSIKTVAVLGRFAKQHRFQGGGSSHIVPTKVETAYDELARLLDGKAEIKYADGYPEEDRVDEAVLQEAAKLAQSSDVALIFAGLPESYESEGFDRKHINMPPSHNRLIEEVCRAQPQTVVVLANGSAVSMPWVAAPKAILETWLGGQAVGGAIADVLLGIVNPSGKLPETFPVRLEDTPAYLHYPGDEDTVRYGEGMYVGYRYYDKKVVKPLFPFGYGLSYTTFEYSDIQLYKTQVSDTEPLEVSVTVKNTGERSGEEIVQLYVRDLDSSVSRPMKELKAFARVSLQPGEQKTVTLTLTRRDFAYYDSVRQMWVVESGDFEILVGRSSQAIELSATVTVESTQQLPYHYHRLSPIKHFMRHPVAGEKLSQMFPPELNNPSQPEMREMFMSMPVGKLVVFSRGQFTEEQLEALLQEINAAVNA